MLGCAVFSQDLHILLCMRFQLSFNFVKSKSKFFFTRCITLKHVMSLRCPSPRHCAQATRLISKKCRSSGEPLATLPDLTGPRFDLLTPKKNALPLDQQASHLTSFQVKLYYKQVCNISFLFFQMTYSSNGLKMNLRV